MKITTPGTYDLIDKEPSQLTYIGPIKFTSTSACIEINSTDVVLDCKNQIIKSKTDYGVVILKSKNVILKNCKFEGFPAGVLVGDSENVYLDNIEVNNSEYGVFIQKTNNSEVRGIKINSRQNGLTIDSESSNNKIFDSFSYGGKTGFLINGNFTQIKNSEATENDFGFIFRGNNVLIDGIKTYSSKQFGLQFESVENGTLLNSRVENVTGIGITVEDSKVNFQNIEAIKNSRGGIYVFNSSVNLNHIQTIENRYYGLIFIGSKQTMQDIQSCKTNIFDPNTEHSERSADILFFNETSTTKELLTCDFSYPEGLCNNPCPKEYIPQEKKPIENPSCCGIPLLLTLLVVKIKKK